MMKSGHRLMMRLKIEIRKAVNITRTTSKIMRAITAAGDAEVENRMNQIRILTKILIKTNLNNFRSSLT